MLSVNKMLDALSIDQDIHGIQYLFLIQIIETANHKRLQTAG